jgi:hypothetical protein
MAIDVHYVTIDLIKIAPDGSAYHSSGNNRTIGECLRFTTEHRIMSDASIPNSANNPTIQQYLVLEGADDYEPVQIGQYFIITMKRDSGS